MLLVQLRRAVVAELSAGPETPTQAHDFVAALGTEVGSISREERQVCEGPFVINAIAL